MKVRAGAMLRGAWITGAIFATLATFAPGHVVALDAGVTASTAVTAPVVTTPVTSPRTVPLTAPPTVQVDPTVTVSAPTSPQGEPPASAIPAATTASVPPAGLGTTHAPATSSGRPRSTTVTASTSTTLATATTTTIKPLEGQFSTPPSTLPLITKAQSAHVDPILAKLSIGGFVLAGLIMITQFLLTRPGRQGRRSL